jgi:hypothetical protein
MKVNSKIWLIARLSINHSGYLLENHTLFGKHILRCFTGAPPQWQKRPRAQHPNVKLTDPVKRGNSTPARWPFPYPVHCPQPQASISSLSCYLYKPWIYW